MAEVVETPETTTRRLYAEMVKAEFNYLQHLRQTHLVKFQQETQNFVVDKDHSYYRYFFPTRKEVKLHQEVESASHLEKLDDETKSHYRKLVVQLHPDKCAEPWAPTLFLQLQKAYETNDGVAINSMFNYFEEHVTLQGYDLMTYTQQITQWKNEVWYQFYHGSMKTQWQEIFLSSEKLQRVQEQRQTKIAEEMVQLKEGIRYQEEQQAKLIEAIANLQKAAVAPRADFQEILKKYDINHGTHFASEKSEAEKSEAKKSEAENSGAENSTG